MSILQMRNLRLWVGSQLLGNAQPGWSDRLGIGPMLLEVTSFVCRIVWQCMESAGKSSLDNGWTVSLVGVESLLFLSLAAVGHSWPVAALLWPHT